MWQLEMLQLERLVRIEAATYWRKTIMSFDAPAVMHSVFVSSGALLCSGVSSDYAKDDLDPRLGARCRAVLSWTCCSA